MSDKIEYEKIIIPLGRINVLKAAIRSMKKSDRKFSKQMEKMPLIQKLATHCYCYFPAEYARTLKSKYEDIHYDKYGYVD